MSASRRRFARAVTLPAFGLGLAGWALGLVEVQASASAVAMLGSTASGMLAAVGLVAWLRLGDAASR